MKTTFLCLLVLVMMSMPSLAAEDLKSVPAFAKSIEFWRNHILLTNASHAAGGFGLALLLQRYLAGKSGLMVIGWLLLAFTLVTHVVAFV